MLSEAADWIKANPRAKQPWDQRGFEFPGGVQPESEGETSLPAVRQCS